MSWSDPGLPDTVKCLIVSDKESPCRGEKSRSLGVAQLTQLTHALFCRRIVSVYMYQLLHQLVEGCGLNNNRYIHLFEQKDLKCNGKRGQTLFWKNPEAAMASVLTHVYPDNNDGKTTD